MKREMSTGKTAMASAEKKSRRADEQTERRTGSFLRFVICERHHFETN
jgi:hypothetical protein